MFEKKVFVIENSIAMESTWTWHNGVRACTLQDDELTPGSICKMVVVAAPVSNTHRVSPATQG